MPPYKPVKDRFEESYIPVTESGCWIWLRYTNACGYGVMGYSGNKTKLAHRVAWELYYGPIPKGMCICHTCDTPACVRPDHLFMGTHADNIRDCAKKKRIKVPAKFGENHPFAKITNETILKIRKDKRSLSKIAEDYGLSFGYVGRIKRHEAWKHI